MRASGNGWLWFVPLLMACSAQPVEPPVGSCDALFSNWTDASADHRDSRYRPVEGVYGLRTDRLSAALASAPSTAEQRQLWLQRLTDNDRRARRVELSNLPVSQRARWSTAAIQNRLDACRTQQTRQLLDHPPSFERLRSASQVTSDYSFWARAFGAYPLFKPIYQRGIAAWQAEAARYQAPADSPGWLSYQPQPYPPSGQVRVATDALGLPQPDSQQRAALLARHAPHLRVEQASQADRIGSPRFDGQGRREFAATQPQLYQQLGWSRIDGRWRLQLIYQLWFSERPKTHALDLLGGELDGLIWRVTLDERGNALLYDSIHPCGCWHGFYLPADSALAFQQPDGQEARSVRRLSIKGTEGATLWLSSSAHQLLWVDGRRSTFPSMVYDQQPLEQLSQLPHPQGSRSLYAQDGLVEGSERLERWLLWPSGVRSPGAMRQWGRHATAFVGEAHFDDPDLLARYFHTP
ncbi:hypothetical protein ACX0MV_10665 [Pseudomonas borbori]